VALLTIGAGVSQVYLGGSGNPVKTHPAPTLFTPAQIAPLAQELAAQKPRADQAFAAWSAVHPERDDVAFTAFALGQLGPPPDANIQSAELEELRGLAGTRTPTGMTAAAWLETYGKKDIWKLYLSDATETAGSKAKKQANAAFKADTTLAKALTAAAQSRFGRQAPTVEDPTLRQGTARKVKLSYPSKHTVYVSSELALLAALDPGREKDFQDMADQVAFSRLYAAGHYRSDLVAGAFLGDLLGDYEVRNLGTVMAISASAGPALPTSAPPQTAAPAAAPTTASPQTPTPAGSATTDPAGTEHPSTWWPWTRSG
jgi:hypothetical protein